MNYPRFLLLAVLFAALLAGGFFYFVQLSQLAPKNTAIVSQPTNAIVPTPKTTPRLPQPSQQPIIPPPEKELPKKTPKPPILVPTPVAHSLPSKEVGGMVSINFDDGYESMYQNGIPILNKAGLKSTQYIITQRIGSKSYMTKEQILELASQGHEIGAHTQHHPHLPQLSQDMQRNEIVGSKNDLSTIGINAATFAYPFGEFNDTSVQLVQEAGFIGARSVIRGFNTPTTSRFLLNDQTVNSDTSIDQVKSWIDQAIQNHSWLILLFHRVDEQGNSISVTHEFLQQVVDYLVATKVRVVTNEQGIHLLYKI